MSVAQKIEDGKKCLDVSLTDRGMNWLLSILLLTVIVPVSNTAAFCSGSQLGDFVTSS
jgi:hypothetical protein